MLGGSKLSAIFLIGLLLLAPASLVLAVWDAGITYYGETLADGYSWSQDLPFDGYVWDPLAWDFIYGVTLLDNESDDPLAHPIDHFQVGNPYGAEWTITYTPEGWWPLADTSDNQETIDWMGSKGYFILEGETNYFAFTSESHPGPVVSKSENYGHSNNDTVPGPVPEPGALLLIGSGLAGLGGFARLKLRRRRKS